VLSIPLVNDIVDEADAVCSDIKVCAPPVAVFSNSVILATEASLIPAGKLLHQL
jgi:hypothetical protein